jgi:hypothetical protein
MLLLMELKVKERMYEKILSYTYSILKAVSSLQGEGIKHRVGKTRRSISLGIGLSKSCFLSGRTSMWCGSIGW